MENPLNTRGKNHGHQAERTSLYRESVTTPTAAAYKKRINQSPMENPNGYL
jgi:hypothetical protein